MTARNIEIFFAAMGGAMLPGLVMAYMASRKPRRD